MKQTIKLSIKASSINSAHYNDKRLGYNTETKKWIAEVCRQLKHPLNKFAMSMLHATFDPKKHCFSVFVDYTTPEYFNKQKEISARSMDVGNITKTLLDVVFTPDFNGEGDRKSQNINVDDKYISTLITRKKPGTSYEISLVVKIKKLPGV